jgi:hypothetical protein
MNNLKELTLKNNISLKSLTIIIYEISKLQNLNKLVIKSKLTYDIGFFLDEKAAQSISNLTQLT